MKRIKVRSGTQKFWVTGPKKMRYWENLAKRIGQIYDKKEPIKILQRKDD